MWVFLGLCPPGHEGGYTTEFSEHFAHHLRSGDDSEDELLIKYTRYHPANAANASTVETSTHGRRRSMGRLRSGRLQAFKCFIKESMKVAPETLVQYTSYDQGVPEVILCSQKLYMQIPSTLLRGMSSPQKLSWFLTSKSRRIILKNKDEDHKGEQTQFTEKHQIFAQKHLNRKGLEVSVHGRLAPRRKHLDKRAQQSRSL
ncbi:PREDICTED: uncharacterized protein LOC106149271 [Chinchilla lanigera]|uniref:uncharacterized protein LOC106149271 n=1 Tax=Chinchilla lanigera TaxID=34839 RepID=UPI000695EAC6|nr:PREDICTED: uncharacterized protein LOC106149271 [Chinchilla lanigera]